MKALLYQGNQSFAIKEIQPEPLKKGEVRLKVAYCGICGTDVHVYHGHMDQRVKSPQVIGHEASAVIEEIGEGVSGWKPGDKVAVRPLQTGEEDPSDNGCAHIGRNMKFIGVDTPGAMQQYWNVPAYTLHSLPDTLSLKTAALIEPLAVACHDVRLGEVRRGEQVLVIGGGPIGLLIALVSKEKGANVTVSEINETRLELAASLGFQTVNPLQSDLVKEVERITSGAMADVVFEVSGTQAGVSAMTQLPRARGRIVMVAIHAQPREVDVFRFFFRELKLIGARVYEPEDFDEAIAYTVSGKLPLDRLITQVLPLEKAQEAFEAIDADPAGVKFLLEI